MNDRSSARSPWWFWLAASFALIWNLLGVAAYIVEAYGMGQQSDTHRMLSQTRPVWATSAYALAVFAGAAGCLSLLLRRRWAKTLLVVSLIALLVQQAWTLFVSDAIALLGAGAVGFPAAVILVSAALVWFATHSEARGWLR
jgi:hypothetical protein